jgi:heme/copper-type cytochrome/quinol oxidase subunit 1
MTTIDTASPRASAGIDVARAPSSVAVWITTSDHKRLGRLLIVMGLLALVGISAVGLLLGFERIDSTTAALNANSITQLFAMYRVGLAFFVVLPIMLGLAVAVVPLQLGARSLAFPRLATAGFWAWFFGMILVVISIASNGGPGGGAPKFVALFIAAYGVMLVGLTAIAGSVATTVLTTRAPGMNMRRVPLFSWSALVSALGLLLVLPVAFGTVIYLYVSYRYNKVAFGGNKGILDYLGFSITQPTTFLYVLPAIGFAAEMIPVIARRRLPMRGAVLVGLGLVGVGALGGVTQVIPTLDWSGTGINLDQFGTKLGDLLNYALFMALPILGVLMVLAVVPLAFKGGQPKITSPFVFGFFGLCMILVGMLGALINGVTDLGLRATVFEEGVYTYVCYGAVLSGMGAIAYWGPKLWGRRLPEKKLILLALAGTAAVVLSSLPHYVAGFADQPAATVIFDYSGPKNLWNILVTIGHGLMLLTVLGFAGVAVGGFRRGHLAGDDPWDAQTLEWATSSPPPDNNFSDVYSVISAEPLLDLKSTGGNS